MHAGAAALNQRKTKSACGILKSAMPRTKQQRPRHIETRPSEHGDVCSEEYESSPDEAEPFRPSIQSPSSHESLSNLLAREYHTGIELAPQTLVSPMLKQDIDASVEGYNHYKELLKKIISTNCVWNRKKNQGQVAIAGSEKDEGKSETRHELANINNGERDLLNGISGEWSNDPSIGTMLGHAIYNPFRVMAKIMQQSKKQDGELRLRSVSPDNYGEAQDENHGQSSSETAFVDGTGEDLTKYRRTDKDANPPDKPPVLHHRNPTEEMPLSVLRKPNLVRQTSREKPNDGKPAVNCPVPTPHTSLSQETEHMQKEGDPSPNQPKMETPHILEKITKLQQEQYFGFGAPLVPWSALPPAFMLPGQPIPLSGFNAPIKWTAENEPTWKIYRENNSNSPSRANEIMRKRKHEGREDASRKKSRAGVDLSVGGLDSLWSDATISSYPFYHKNTCSSQNSVSRTKSTHPPSRSPIPAERCPALPLHFDFSMSTPHYLNPWAMIYPQIHGAARLMVPRQYPQSVHTDRFLSGNHSEPRSENYSSPAVSHNTTTRAGKDSNPRPKPNFNDPLQNLHDQIVREAKEKNKGMDPENMYIECPVCRKRIKRLYHFQRHMRIHTGEKTHSCPNCPYKSVRKDNLKSHMKTHDKTKFVPSKRPQARRETDELPNFHVRNDYYRPNLQNKTAEELRNPTHQSLTSSPNAIPPEHPGETNLHTPPYERTFVKQSSHAALLPSCFGITDGGRCISLLSGACGFPPSFHDRLSRDNPSYSTLISVPPIATSSFGNDDEGLLRSPDHIIKLHEGDTSPENDTENFGRTNAKAPTNSAGGMHNGPPSSIKKQERDPRTASFSDSLCEWRIKSLERHQITNNKNEIDSCASTKNTEPINSNNCNNTAPSTISSSTPLPCTLDLATTRYGSELIPTAKTAATENITNALPHLLKHSESLPKTIDTPRKSLADSETGGSHHTSLSECDPKNQGHSLRSLIPNASLATGESHFTNAVTPSDDAAKMNCGTEYSSSDDAVFLEQSTSVSESRSEVEHHSSPCFVYEGISNDNNMSAEICATQTNSFFRHRSECSRTRRISSAPELDKVYDRGMLILPVRFRGGRRSPDENIFMTKESTRKPGFDNEKTGQVDTLRVSTQHLFSAMRYRSIKNATCEGKGKKYYVPVELPGPTKHCQTQTLTLPGINSFEEGSPGITAGSTNELDVRYKLQPTCVAPNRVFKCRLCNFVALNNSSLQEHMSVHKEYGLYKCQDCDYRGKNLSKLVEHKRIHTGERPFQCDQCSYAAKRKDNLAQHKSVKHDKNRFKGSATVLTLAGRPDCDIEKYRMSSETMHDEVTEHKIRRETHETDHPTLSVSATRLEDAMVTGYIPGAWNTPYRETQIGSHPALSRKWLAELNHGAFSSNNKSTNIGANGQKLGANDKLFESPNLLHAIAHHTHTMLPFGTMASSLMFGHPLVASLVSDRTTVNCNQSPDRGKKIACEYLHSSSDAGRMQHAKPGRNSYQSALQQCAQ